LPRSLFLRRGITGSEPRASMCSLSA
jgi:hypothetical protein